MDREIKRKRFEIEQEEFIGNKRAKSTGDADLDHRSGEEAAEEDLRRREDGGSCDGEVEEFFAILRRIHVAVKYFERSRSRSGSSDGEKAARVAETPKAKGKAVVAAPWSPNFRREDFGGGGRNGNGNGNKRTVGDNAWLDLNVKPDPVDE